VSSSWCRNRTVGREVWDKLLFVVHINCHQTFKMFAIELNTMHVYTLLFMIKYDPD
jgi:hypothetical protein